MPAFYFSACEDEKVKVGSVELTKEDLKDAKSALQELRDLKETEPAEYRRALEERLEIFEQKLDELGEKAARQPVAELRDIAERAGKKIEEAADATDEDWAQEHKKTIESILDELVDAYEKIEESCS